MSAANENRTHIYRIRRKADGMFLVSAPSPTPYGNEDGQSNQSHLWGPIGTFWKKPETIKAHLLALCQFRIFCGHGIDMPALPYSNSQRTKGLREKYGDHWPLYPWDVPHRLVKTVYERLDHYQVVATEITVHGENVMEAKDFASFLPLDERTVSA